MKKTQIIHLLEDLCSRLSIIVKYDRFFGNGGYCRLRDKNYFIINERLSNDAKEQIFIKELKNLDLDPSTLSDNVREVLNKN